MDMLSLYNKLKKKHGKPSGQWDLWCKRPKSAKDKEAVIIESVLTQRANWKNVSMAAENLKNAGVLELRKILLTGDTTLQKLIKPSGFYKIKATRLKTLCKFIVEECGGTNKAMKMPDEILRERLLALNGIGDETADDILLYAFEKPVFVIDEYTRRLVKKLGLTDDLSYRHLQDFFQKGLRRKDHALYQDFHALIVIDGKKTK